MSETVETDQYAAWRASLNGETSCFNMNELSSGRFKTKQFGKVVGVAIWDEDGETHMTMDGRYISDVERRHDIWPFCIPVNVQEYEFLVDPKLQDPVYAQLPESPVELLARVQAIGAQPTNIGNEIEAQRISDAAHILKQIEKKADERAKELAAPLKEQIAQTVGPWSEVAANAKAVRGPVMGALERHLKAKNEPGGVKGQLGKAISLRTHKVVMVHDLEAALAHFTKKDPAAFEALVEKLARAAIKNGEGVPGVEIQEVRRAQ